MEKCKKVIQEQYIENISSNMEWRVWITYGSYSTSDIQEFYEYILKKPGKKTVNPSIRIHANKICK